MSSDREAVIKVLEDYRDGTFKKDVALLKRVFHPEARMTGFLGPNMLIGTPQPFFDDIANNPSMEESGAPFVAEIKDVVVTGGRVAHAIVHETGFFGSAELQDHMHLIKDKDGQWKIISKCFTSL